MESQDVNTLARFLCDHPQQRLATSLSPCHVFQIHSLLWMPLIFLRDAIRSVQHWSTFMRAYGVSGVVSLRGVERSEQNTQTQQIVDFLQKADDGLGLGDEAIDCFEVAQRQALVTG